MKQLSVKDFKCAMSYVCKNDGRQFQDVSDEDFLKLDFAKDLKMGNIRVAAVVIELQRIHQLSIPWEIVRATKDNTIGSLMEAINRYIEDFPNI